MDVLLALVIMFCEGNYHDAPNEEKQCIQEFNKCRERHIWGYLEHPWPYGEEMENSAFLECHEKFLNGQRKWH